MIPRDVRIRSHPRLQGEAVRESSLEVAGAADGGSARVGARGGGGAGEAVVAGRARVEVRTEVAVHALETGALRRAGRGERREGKRRAERRGEKGR